MSGSTRAARATSLKTGLGPGQWLEPPKPKTAQPPGLKLAKALSAATAELRKANAPGTDLSGARPDAWLPQALADLIEQATALQRTMAPETPPVAERLCACGCGRPIPSPRPEAKYATGACRVRAHRAR